jgi:predicted dehydrogenase
MNTLQFNKIKTGIIGIGNSGMQYILRLQQNERFEMVGFADAHPHFYTHLTDEYKLHFYENPQDLLEACDAVIICNPNSYVMKYLYMGIRQGRHILLGKPLMHDLQEILYMEDLVCESGIKMQISLPDSFNPVFRNLKNAVSEPIFVDMKRNITFESAKNNTQIVQELLLNDICLLLALSNGKVQKVRYNNAYKQLDFMQVRIEFDNGSAAHISINKLSNTKNFAVQVYQASKTITANFLTGRINTLSQNDTHLTETHIEVDETDTLNEELNAFADSILNNTECKNTIGDFYKAAELMRFMVINQEALAE